MTDEEIKKSIEQSREKYRQRNLKQAEKTKEEKTLLKLLKQNVYGITTQAFGDVLSENDKTSRVVTFAFIKDSGLYDDVMISRVYITTHNPKDRFDKRQARLELAKKIFVDEEEPLFHAALSKKFEKCDFLVNHLTKISCHKLTELAYDSDFLPRTLRTVIIEDAKSYEDEVQF